ncbi:MAG: hypothetical protein AAF467_22895 [Actinomycetota bacterium]
MLAMVRMISWRAVAEGTAIGTVVLMLLAGLAQLAVGDDPAAVWSLVFVAASVVALACAGFGAGRRRLDLPMVHGAAAAIGAAIITIVAQLVVGDAELSDLTPAGLALTAVVALAAGVGGALGADWLHRRRRRSEQTARLVGAQPDDRNAPGAQ